MKGLYVGALCGSLVSAILVGIPVTNAYAVPGVDKPYDPVNYYSLTTVSYADSPSPFAIRELMAGQGNHTKIQMGGVDKILKNIPPDVIKGAQYAKDMYNILNEINRGTKNETAIKKYLGQFIIPDLKKETNALGLGDNEKKYLDQMIDAAFNMEGDALEEFAKKLTRNTAETVVKDYLKKELMKESNKYATIMISGCINGKGMADITAEAIGVGTPVYDYLREVQEILENEKVKKILEKLNIKTSDLQAMMAKLPTGVQEKLKKKREKLNEVTKEINTTAHDTITDEKLFGTTPEEREKNKYNPEKTKDKTYATRAEKHEALQKEYKRIVEVVQKNRNDVINQYDALKEILELNSQVMGEQQAVELNTRAKALHAEILTRENIIMSQLVQLRAIKQRMEASEEEDAREILLTVAESAKIPDPFDEDEKKEMERIGYKRHEVPDKMPDFK
ncbi:MAG: hypothetical protein IKN43_01940 [Selenomonadaceae bacterium]|nr:hypothetical protein [Selenomonadaceae bacterium]